MVGDIGIAVSLLHVYPVYRVYRSIFYVVNIKLDSILNHLSSYPDLLIGLHDQTLLNVVFCLVEMS